MNWSRRHEPAASDGVRGSAPRPGFIRRHPWLSALGLVAALLLTNFSRVHGGSGQHHHGEIPLISILVVLPVLWRKRAPMAAFLCSAGAAAIQWAVSGPLFADLALLVCFYTVAATSSRRRTLVAAAILEFGVVIAVLKYGQGGYALAALFLTGLVVAAGMLGINIQVRRAYLAEMEAKAARLEYERDQQGRLAVAAERNRIAREMHDIVAHNLSVMIALNDGASFTMRSDPARAAEAVREASSVGRTALSELRRALAVLRAADTGGADDDTASRTPTPKIADLDRLLTPIRRTGLDVSLTIEGPVAALSPGLQLTVYRLVQESLTNTVKHAVRADHASVTIRTGPAGTEVWVLDNGSSSEGQFSARQFGPGSGHGIIGMHERAAGHGGRVEAGRTPTGWMVRAWFPVETPAAALAMTAEPVGAHW